MSCPIQLTTYEEGTRKIRALSVMWYLRLLLWIPAAKQYHCQPTASISLLGVLDVPLEQGTNSVRSDLAGAIFRLM